MNNFESVRCLIFIINWQQCEETLHLLTTSNFNSDRFDIFIFDNEASDKTRTFFNKHATHYNYYESSDVNLGFATPCNIGLNFAAAQHYEFILFLNNDARMANKDAELMLDALNEHKNIALASPLIKDLSNEKITFSGAILNPERTIITHVKPEDIPEELNTHHFLLYGTALMGRVTALNIVNGFYEPFFAYWEDCLLSANLISAGYACAIISAASVFHKNDRSDETDTPRSQYYYYYLIRNEIIFWKQISYTPMKPIYWLVCHALADIISLIKKSAYAQATAILIGMFDGFLGYSGKWQKHITKIN